MATLERYRGKIATALKKAAAIVATMGFFAAAIMLAAILWLPAHAAPPSPAVDAQASLFLALDAPTRPTPKLHLLDLSLLTTEEVDLAAAAQPDLTTELNSWTYTQSSMQQQLYLAYVMADLHFNPLYNLLAYIQYAVYTALLDALMGHPSPALGLFIDFLEYAQHTLSPYS